jgi:hypothetical protein
LIKKLFDHTEHGETQAVNTDNKNISVESLPAYSFWLLYNLFTIVSFAETVK